MTFGGSRSACEKKRNQQRRRMGVHPFICCCLEAQLPSVLIGKSIKTGHWMSMDSYGEWELYQASVLEAHQMQVGGDDTVLGNHFMVSNDPHRLICGSTAARMGAFGAFSRCLPGLKAYSG